MHKKKEVTKLGIAKFKGWRMVLRKTFGSRKILADFHGSRSLAFSAVVCVSES